MGTRQIHRVYLIGIPAEISFSSLKPLSRASRTASVDGDRQILTRRDVKRVAAGQLRHDSLPVFRQSRLRTHSYGRSLAKLPGLAPGDLDLAAVIELNV
jgi:hypothetical protein